MQNRLIFILGSQSSGSSLLANYFRLAGFALSPKAAATTFWEDTRLNALNELLLTRNGISWHQPVPGRLTVPTAKTDDLCRLYLAANPQTEILKDPRFCLTWPCWKNIAPDIDFIITFRHPLATVLSMASRFNLSRRHALNLWLSYYTNVRGFLSPFIEFGSEISFDDYRDNLIRVCRFLELPFDETALARAFDSIKIHYAGSSSLASPLPGQHAALYNQLVTNAQAT